jgi:hypothetical protein
MIKPNHLQEIDIMNHPQKTCTFLIIIFSIFTLTGCGSSQDDQIDLVPLIEDAATPIPTAWEVVGEIAYTDEYGTSDYSLTGEFTVDNNNVISGSGKGLILHSGPCYVLSDPYPFTIQGYYDPEEGIFVFEEFFGEEAGEDEENSDLEIMVDNTFVSCTLGESSGELFALLRPLILLAQADHGALANGQVPIPANDRAYYRVEFPGGFFSMALLKN